MVTREASIAGRPRYRSRNQGLDARQGDEVATRVAHPLATQRMERRFPLSQWYVLPVVDQFASWLAGTRVRPIYVTAIGAALGLTAVCVIVYAPTMRGAAAVCVFLAWVADRLDGELARRQGTVSTYGAWFDANVDETLDVAIHASMAFALFAGTGSVVGWLLLAAFLGGKHLFRVSCDEERACAEEQQPFGEAIPSNGGWLHTFYHGPGNADVRLHVVVICVTLGWYVAALAYAAVYFNMRWIARHALVYSRLRETGQ